MGETRRNTPRLHIQTGISTLAEQIYRAYICCGPNCGPKGSGTLLDFLEAEVARQGLTESVSVLPTGCQSHCESGPTMVVYPGPVYYQNVDRPRLTLIVNEHFIEGRPVAAFFWNGVRKRLLSQQERRAAWTARQADFTYEAVKPAEPSVPPQKPRRAAPPVDDFKW